MKPARRRAVIALAVIGALGAAGLLAACSSQARRPELARDRPPLQAHPPRPALRLLIVGDSTAAGTGALQLDNSVAGRLAAAFPRLEVVNRGVVGARFADLPAQLQPGGGPFDLVLVMCGGNDVIRLTGHDALAADVERVLAAAGALAPRVVLLPCGNVGNAPFFDEPWLMGPVAWLMTRRSRELHACTRCWTRPPRATARAR